MRFSLGIQGGTSIRVPIVSCMFDHNGENKKRKRTQFASIFVGIGSLIGVLALVFLNPAQKVAPRVPPAPSDAPKPVSLKPAPPFAVLGRSELLAVARSAASIFAAEGKLGGHNSVLQRRFSVRIAFGCYEDGNNGGQTSLTFNPDYRSAVLSATPGEWVAPLLADPLSASVGIEAVEGFWIPRAWTDSEVCPPQANYLQPVSPTPPAAQSVGLAQLFLAGGARQGRHAEKPYLFTRKLPASEPELQTRHYFLLLEGRITGFPDGRDLHCWMEGADHRPRCIFAVEFDNVAFEDGVTGKVLASWRS